MPRPWLAAALFALFAPLSAWAAGVQATLDRNTVQLGETVMVSIKAVMRERGSAEAMVAAINECEQAMRREFPQIRWLFFEPDIKD